MKNRYQVSEAFKESCKANVGLNRYGRIHVIEDNIDIVGENYDGQLVDFTIEDNCYVNDKFIGTTVAKKITVNILNPDNSINLENKTIEAYVGIYINGKLEEVPYGTYIIEKPANEEVKQKTSFTGYDYMIKFNVPYKDRVKYPIKASELLLDLCNQVGLELGNTDFVNADYMILGNPFTNNEDCRTVLSNIAQLAGTFAKIGRDNKLYICTLKNIPDLMRVKDIHNMPVKDLHLLPVSMLSTYKDNTEENLNGNNYFEDFAKNEEWGNVNSLVLSISDIEGENTARTDEESIKKDGLTEITIADNYFLINQEEREKVIEPLWESLKGLRYLPFKTKYYGYPHLDSGDPIAVEDTKDVQFLSYVFNHTFTFNGAFSGNLDTPAMTKTQTAYKNTQNTKSKLKRAERKIDKINGVIEDILEEQTETETKLSQHQQTIDSITDTVSSVTEELNTTKEELKGDIEQAEDNINKNLSENYWTKTETNSQITQKADSITSEVNQTIKEAKQEAIDSADNNTDNKLQNYSTTKEINSQILQTAKNISSEVSEIYSTKTETNTAKQDAINSANASTDEKLVQMNTKIEQTANSINMEVSKKINEDEIISKINMSPEKILISGDKVDINGKAVHFKTNISEKIGPFTQTDLDKVNNYMMGQGTLTPQELEKYDINGDGEISSSDVLNILRSVNNGGYRNFDGTFEINPYSYNKSISLYNNSTNRYEVILSLIYNYLNEIECRKHRCKWSICCL